MNDMRSRQNHWCKYLLISVMLKINNPELEWRCLSLILAGLELVRVLMIDFKVEKMTTLKAHRT